MLRTEDMLPSTDASNALDDERLVQAVASGDREALGMLYDRFAPGMLSVAQRIVGSSRESEDLVHDVFLEAWHRARHYDRSRGSVRTWLMMRLRSRGLDRLRASKRAPTVELETAKLSLLEAQQPDAGEARDGQLLRGALAELHEDQRAVLELGYFAGCSCSEIAARLKIPIGTVKSRMSRAIAELRVRFDAQQAGQS